MYALERGEIDADEYLIGCYFAQASYVVQKTNAGVVLVTLAGLAEKLKYEKTAETLRRKVQGLSAKGWISFTVTERQRTPWEIRLTGLALNVSATPTATRELPHARQLPGNGLADEGGAFSDEQGEFGAWPRHACGSDAAPDETRREEDQISSRREKDPSPSSVAQHEEGQIVQEPAAAEPPSHADVQTAVAELRNSDAGTFRRIEPLAVQLPAPVFWAVVEKTRSRRGVGNDAGLLVTLLRDEVMDRQQQALAALPSKDPAQFAENNKRFFPEHWVGSASDAMDEAGLEAYLVEYVPEEERREVLRSMWVDRCHREAARRTAIVSSESEAA